MNRYAHILSLYVRNPAFRTISIVFLVSAAVSKGCYVQGHGSWGEDAATVLLVTTLWLTFHVGILFKRQFANQRAALLPNYRAAHLRCAVAVYSFYVLIALFWDDGLVPLLNITPHGLQGLYMLCALTAVFITYLGYLSITRAFIYGYIILLIMATQALHIIVILDATPYAKYILGGVALMFLCVFQWRLRNLREEHVEYGYLLSWPPKAYIHNQGKPARRLPKVPEALREMWRNSTQQASLDPYPRAEGLWQRAKHWEQSETVKMKLLCALLLLVSPAYVMLVRSQPAVNEFFRNVYSNFLVLAATPVLMTIGAQYKTMAYWGHDLLKPVEKPVYIKERGVILLTRLLVYWMIVVVYFAILPALVFQPAVLSTLKYWVFLLLTGSFALLMLAWLTLLSCSRKSWVVVLNAITLSCIVVFQFYGAAGLSFSVTVWLNVVYMLAGMAMLYKAYHAWCEKEFG